MRPKGPEKCFSLTFSLPSPPLLPPITMESVSTTDVHICTVNQTKDGMQQEEKTKDHFLGVMGTDVPLNYLKEFMLQPLVS